jgi:DeoR/GlpR family transcriptional regulator of sugar metabolism
MLPEERRRHILQDIETGNAAEVGALSEKYAVSEMTIRRDLKVLEDDGHIRRAHGGAIRLTSSTVEPRYAAKQKVNASRKERIAQYVAEQLVSDGDIIILEGGTTVTSLAHRLTVRPGLTVVTNGLYTTNELRHLLPHVSVICTGGILRDVSFTYVGPTAERFFQEFHANKLFLSGTGLTLEAGLTDPNMLESQLKRAMISAAGTTIIMLDSSKFGVQSLTTLVHPGRGNILVTNDDAPPDVIEQLYARGVDVRLVPGA